MDTKKLIITMGMMAILIMMPGGGRTMTDGRFLLSKRSDAPQQQMVSKEKPTHKGQSRSSSALPVYKPPKGIGAPGGRVGGGSRGSGQEAPVLFALVPDHLGLTIQEQPVLYWYLSKPSSNPLVLTLNDERLVKPVLQTTVGTDPSHVFHSARLQDYNVRLELDTEYRWFVELVEDDDHASKNIVAGGRIKRIVPPEGLLNQLRQAEPEQKTSIYAEAGLWYDAMASISELIESRKNGTHLRESRNALLEQVDLIELLKAEEDIAIPTESGNWDSSEFRSLFAKDSDGY